MLDLGPLRSDLSKFDLNGKGNSLWSIQMRTEKFRFRPGPTRQYKDYNTFVLPERPPPPPPSPPPPPPVLPLSSTIVPKLKKKQEKIKQKTIDESGKTFRWKREQERKKQEDPDFTVIHEKLKLILIIDIKKNKNNQKDYSRCP